MLKILILDDNNSKIQKISQILKKIDGITEKDIYPAPDIVTAKKALSDLNFDLLLLDIQIPNRFDQNPQRDGGMKFLESIKASKKYSVPANIIGITAYNDIYDEAKPKFHQELQAIIKYEENSVNWIEQLKSKVEHLIAAKSKSKAVSESYDYDLAIICALDKIELESIKNLPGSWKENKLKNDSTIYYTGVFNSEGKSINVVAAAAPQMGMPAAAVLAMKLIHNFRPEYLVMTGIAAGVRGKVSLGDILVADPSWDYGAGKITDDGGTSLFLPEPRQIRIEPEISEKIQSISSKQQIFDVIKNRCPFDTPSWPLSLYIGPVASGASVIANSNIAQDIISHNRNLIGIEMETYAVLYAAQHCMKPRPKSFSVKSVCDFADEEKNDKFQKYAAYTSANFLYELVTNHLDFSKNIEFNNFSSTA